MWWTNFICSLLLTMGMNTVVGWTADQVDLCWDAPVLNADGTECTDLAGYNVYVNGVKVDKSIPKAEHEAGSGCCSGVLSDGDSVYVTAYDLSGNESGPSNTINYTDGVYSCGSGAQNLRVK